MAGKGSHAHDQTTRIQAHVLIIESRYYEAIADELAAGAIAELTAVGATYDRLVVPGALEIPQALAAAVAAGLLPADTAGAKYDGAIALGCVIRGETSHYDIVCNQTNHWMMDVAIRAGVPFGNAVLTVENEAQAMARAKGGRAGKGADAVRACLSIVAHTRAFEEIDE
jgi:6,7-dimethyl-8-ribityllumazine synthase